MLTLSATERERAIGDVLASLFYGQMVTPPSERRVGTREEIHRLLFGMIANRMTRYEFALALPILLCERLECDDIFACLLDHTAEQIAEVIAAPKALHRYPMRIATSLCASARQIESDWKSDVRTMFEGEILGRELVTRLMSLHGVGEKIGNLTARVLMLNFANVECWGGVVSLRPSPDRHVLRVFYRLGLIENENDFEGLFAAAERCRPFESVSADGAWIIGLERCKASAPECRRNRRGEQGGYCPLLGSCPSAR